MDLAERLRPVQSALRVRLSRADVLTEMIRAVNSSLDPERVADALLDRAVDWVPAPAWLLVAIDDAGRTRALASRALTPTLEPGAQAVGHWVMRNGDVCSAMNLSRDRRFPDAPGAAAIAFPLGCRARTIGALVALDRQPAAREPRLPAATLAAIQTVLEPAAFALDNALRVQRAEALSVTDDLTQLYNSRYLSQVLRRETKRASRNGRPLSLLFIDLDGFKSINDTHGHLYGSRALVDAAGVIRLSARETDVVARFGGDEFALVLPDTGSDGAFAVGERIRDRIAAHAFLHDDGLDIHLTASVGVATLPDVAASAEGLIQAADEAMYAVKDRGKNGICVAGA
ncbi:MAG TPA: GGDEF domain-containing protein [Vicinamibacterales bacterium]|nr:GGDEF domain-containing protein [Vicinamibacterales bacterium]